MALFLFNKGEQKGRRKHHQLFVWDGHPSGFLQDRPSFVVVLIWTILCPPSTVCNNLGSFLEPEKHHQLGRQKKACRGWGRWRPSCGNKKTFGAVKVAARSWGLKETAEGWQLHVGNQIRLANPRLLEKRLIFLVRHFVGQICISMNMQGMLPSKVVISNSNPVTAIAGSPAASTQSGSCLVEHCKPQAAQSALFHCPRFHSCL